MLPLLSRSSHSNIIKYIIISKPNNSSCGETKERAIDDEKDKYRALTLNFAMQEIARQVSFTNRDLGYLLLKVFKGYFMHNERSWFKYVKRSFELLKAERKVMLKSDSLPDDLEGLLKNDTLTVENLEAHKRAIKQMVGKVHEEEDKRVILELEKKHLSSEINSWIYEWDRIKINKKLKNRIDQLDPSKLLETHIKNGDHKTIDKTELALLINAERFITILDHKSKWEIEVDTTLERNKRLAMDTQNLKGLVEYLKEKSTNAEIVARSKEQENANYARVIKNLSSKLQNTQKENKSVQTVLDCTNVKFTEKADNLFKLKAQNENKPIVKLMRKVKMGSSKYQALPLKDILGLISHIYNKKTQALLEGEGLGTSFEEFVYSVMEKRFGIKNKIKQTCEKFLVGLQFFKDEDSRIDAFAKFLGFETDEKYHIEVLYFYIKVMKATEEPIGTLISPEADKLHLETSKIIKKNLEIFGNASSTFKREMRRELIVDSSILVNNKMLVDIGTKEKLQIYVLVIFYTNLLHKYSIPIIQILLKFADDEGMLSISTLRELLEEHVEFEDLEHAFTDDNTFQEFIHRFFGKHISKINDDEKLRVKSMAVFYRHKYQIKIASKKYLNAGLKFSLMFLNQARFQFQRLFEHYDTSGDGKIDFGEFKELVIEMDKTIPGWKIHALFQDATGSDDIDAGISFDEFVSAAMNNPLLDGIMELGYERPIEEKKTSMPPVVEVTEDKPQSKNSDVPKVKSPTKDDDVGKFTGSSDEDEGKESFGLKYLMLKEGIRRNKKTMDMSSGIEKGSHKMFK